MSWLGSSGVCCMVLISMPQLSGMPQSVLGPRILPTASKVEVFFPFPCFWWHEGWGSFPACWTIRLLDRLKYRDAFSTSRDYSFKGCYHSNKPISSIGGAFSSSNLFLVVFAASLALLVTGTAATQS